MVPRSMRSFQSALLSISLMMALILTGHAAMAQSVSRQLGPLSKRMSRATVEKLTNITKMTDDQREQTLVLYDGYASGHKQLLQEADDAYKVVAEEFRESREWESFAKKQRDIVIKLFDDVRAKRATLLADMQSLLTPEQAAHWERCERFLRRDDTSRIGFMAGSMVDVAAVAEQAKVQREGPAADVLDQYETAFDPVAKQWLAKLDEFFKEIKAFDPTERPDEKKIFGMLQEIMELSVKIRNVNRSYAKQLQDILPEETRAAFEQRFQERSFPVVHQKGFVRNFFDNALAAEGLSSQQKDELTALRDSYTRDAALVNAEWTKEIDRRQELATTNPRLLEDAGAEDEALDAARKARKDLDKRTTERIENILDATQLEAATKDLKRDKDIGRDDIMPDFDDLMDEEEE